MTFEVVWAPQARRDLAEFPVEVQRRIILKVRTAAKDPIRFFKRLKGEKVWSLRAGEDRALAFVDLRGRRIEMVAVGHRRNVYD